MVQLHSDSACLHEYAVKDAVAEHRRDAPATTHAPGLVHNKSGWKCMSGRSPRRGSQVPACKAASLRVRFPKLR